MNRSKKAILVLAGSVLIASPSTSDATDLDNVNAWITSNKTWRVCPPFNNNLLLTDPLNPGFAYNNAQLNKSPPHGACHQAGPFVWHPVKRRYDYWFVQVISNLRPNGCVDNSCLKDFVRVCSLAYVRSLNSQPIPGGGPCQGSKGVGPGGCEVCEVPAP